jgi:hypothetical protein
VAGEQGSPVLAVAEVEGLRVWAAEREGISDLAGEARKVAGLVGRWRKQVKRCGVYLSSGRGLLFGLDSAVSDCLQRLGS